MTPDSLNESCNPEPGPASEPSSLEPSTLHPSPSTNLPPSTKSKPRISAVWTGIAFEGGLGVLALIVGWCLGHVPLDRIYPRLLPLFAYAAATLPLLAALALLLSFDWKIVRDLRHFMDGFVLPMFAGARWWELALLCAAAGLGEELLFRGLLQPIFCGALGVGWGIGLVNLLFGLMHPFSVTYVVVASLIGLYLSVLFVISDNLIAPMVVHGLYDFVALFWMLHVRKSAAHRL